MLRQPDALEPDDQHEHQAAPGHRGEEGGERPEGERAHPEQRQPEHGVGDAALHEHKRDQAGDSAGQ